MGYYLAAVLLGPAGVLGLFWLTKPLMTKRARRLAPGRFARLTDGVVHYQWHGPHDGPVLVLVHGLTTPSFVWRDMLPGLTQAGFRVLIFDHFGRGYSDRPWRRHDHRFYTREIDDLLTALKVSKPVHMLGYSMGGGIVTAYAVARPDRVDHLILLAPVGLTGSKPGFVARWPILGDILMFVLGPSRLRAQARAAAREEGTNAEMLRLQLRETRYAGYTGAVLSSLRHAIYMDQTHQHEVLRDRSVPLQAIFAEKDTLIPLTSAQKLSEINPSADIVKVPGAGHAVATSHADAVVTALLRFLPPPAR